MDKAFLIHSVILSVAGLAKRMACKIGRHVCIAISLSIWLEAVNVICEPGCWQTIRRASLTHTLTLNGLRRFFYHEITPDSTYCFLKANCTPSMKISHDPHKVWVCIEKKTRKVCSAYCSCFAGYVKTTTKNWACHPSTQTIHCKNVMLFGMCMGVFSPLLVIFLACTPAHVLTHWDRVTHICATKLGHH